MMIPTDDPLHTSLDAGERRLFLSLWGLLILAFALWHFWPTFEHRGPANAIPVDIGPELTGRFVLANVTQTTPSQYTVNLRLSEKYLHSLPEGGSRMTLGYDFLNGERVLFSGMVSILLSLASETPTIVLPNPERVFSRQIRIYLAH